MVVNIIWEDYCDSDSVLGVKFRSEYGPVGIKASESGNAMYVDTATLGDWTVKPLIKTSGLPGKSFLTEMEHVAGYPDVWLSFLFKIDAIPVNFSMFPQIEVFQLDTMFNWGGHFYPVFGWFLQVSLNTSTRTLFCTVKSSSQPYSYSVSTIASNQIIGGGFDLTKWHRVTFRMTYSSFRRTMTFKEIYFDDVQTPIPPISINASTGYSEDRAVASYNVGRSEYIPYVSEGDLVKQSYGSYRVDDVIVWTGPDYYLYNWLNYTALSVDTVPVNGRVFIDGVDVGLAPLLKEILAGNHVIGFGDVAGYITPPNVTVSVAAGETKEVVAEYLPQGEGTPPGGFPWWILLVAGGVVVVAASAGKKDRTYRFEAKPKPKPKP